MVPPEVVNRWLQENYGATIEGLPLFRIVWSTNLREWRKSTYNDFYGDIFIRCVTEARYSLKYPFAQDRWIIERLHPTPKEVLGRELFTPYTYEELYTFQDKAGNALDVTMDKVEAAMYLFLVARRMTTNDRIDFQYERLARKEAAKKEKIRQIIGQRMRSPLFFVLE